MSRIVIALLLWLVAIATAHAQWRRLPGQPSGDPLPAFVSEVVAGMDLDNLPVLAAVVRVHRL